MMKGARGPRVNNPSALFAARPQPRVPGATPRQAPAPDFSQLKVERTLYAVDGKPHASEAHRKRLGYFYTCI